MSKQRRAITRRQVTEEEYRALDQEDTGICLSCGETQTGVEPDGREYHCEACGDGAVYGVEELMLMGILKLSE